MRDFARSDHPALAAQLARLEALSVPQGRLGLETIRALLRRLGDPQTRLPPVFHVAGTNGKGSVCAFLRAMLEAAGQRVHLTVSPHLVRYNERIRVAGKLIEDDRLAALLKEVLDRGEDLAPSFFEVTIAAALLEFARVPADACVIEVGLGGRLDATNALSAEVLAACGIAALGIDHEAFLLAPEPGAPQDPIARIAFEKAAIAKPGVALVTLDYPPAANREIDAAVRANRAARFALGREWTFAIGAEAEGAPLCYRDAQDEFALPAPSLAGAHQYANAALAVAMLRHQHKIAVPREAMAAGIAGARWPARLQRLAPGPLVGDREVWLDGGHNPSAGEALARHFSGSHLHLVLGMLTSKDPKALVRPLSSALESLQIVPVPGHESHTATAFGDSALAADDLPSALARLPTDGVPVLIAGSLYLAGEALRLNEEIPT